MSHNSRRPSLGEVRGRRPPSRGAPITAADALSYDLEDLAERVAQKLWHRLTGPPCVLCPPRPEPRWPGDARARWQPCPHRRTLAGFDDGEGE